MSVARRIAVGALIALVAVAVGVMPVSATNTITINGNDPNQTVFNGIGYISAGGESRQLLDYPAAQQTQILDVLFCSPDPANVPASGYCTSSIYGAALQLLKIEIGGDSNSSVGAEPSFLHSLAEYNTLQTAFQSGTLQQQQAACHLNRGFEWWLAREARKRNPNIKLYGLAWSAPGWLDQGSGFWSTDTQQYLVDFAKCAAINADSSISATPLNYIGAQNEVDYASTSWIINYKSILVSQMQAAGFPVPQLVCCDLGWTPVVTDINSNPTFSNAVDVVGVHYTYSPPPQSVPQPTWASEDWVTNPPTWPPGVWPGAGQLAQLFSEHYLRDGMVADLIVPVVDAYYDNMASSDWGPILAFKPWSGNYTIEPALWVTAQYTQFTEPGWKFLNGSTCYLGSTGSSDCRTDHSLGSYWSLRSPTSSDWSTIVETINAASSQSIVLCPTGGLARPSLLGMAWSDTSNSLQGSQATDIPISGDNCYHTTVNPDSVYSFTTVSWPFKGEPTPPTDQALGLPYFDNFDGSLSSACPRSASYAVGAQPCWLQDEEGAFAIKANCGSNAYPGGSGGKCIEQQVATPPIQWLGCNGVFSDSIQCNPSDYPNYWTHVGPTGETGSSPAWTNYDLSVLVNGEAGGIVRLFGRVSDQRDAGNQNEFVMPAGYELDVNTSSGEWDLGKREKQQSGGVDYLNYVSIASCHISSCEIPFTPNSWHRLKMRFSGTTSPSITACIDTTQIASVTDTSSTGRTYQSGQVGLATLGTKAQFDDLKVASIAGSACS